MVGVKSPYHSKSLFLANKKRKVAISPVAVEKLFLPKFAKMKLRQDAL